MEHISIIVFVNGNAHVGYETSNWGRFQKLAYVFNISIP